MYLLQEVEEDDDFIILLLYVDDMLVMAPTKIERCWYKRFNSFIISFGYNRLSSDHCTYYKRFEEDDDFIILLLYVDDMLVIGPNKDWMQELKTQLAREFDMKDLGPANKILGM